MVDSKGLLAELTIEGHFQIVVGAHDPSFARLSRWVTCGSECYSNILLASITKESQEHPDS